MAAGQQQRRPGRIGFMVLLLPALGACVVGGSRRGGAASAADEAALATARACQVERAPLVRPDGIEVYVEPQNLLHTDGNLLVTGLPSYTWQVGTDTNATRLTRNAYVAAVRESSTWRTIAVPRTEATLGTVRAVALDGGRWGAVFSEEDPDSLAENKEHVLRLWYGEYDGARWTTLEPMPRPPGRLFVNASSRLVRVGGRLAWSLVQYAPPGPSRVLFYQRDYAGWSVEPMPGDGADNAQLAYDATQGLALAVFGEDPDLPGWQKSLRLYRRGQGWDRVARVALPAPGAEVSTAIALDASGVSVGWIESTAESSAAYARVGVGAAGPNRAIRLDDSAEQLVALPGLAGGTGWLVDHSYASARTRELRFLRVDSTGLLERLASIPSPYTGYFAALATSATEVLVVGPQFDADPAHPVVRSLLLRLSTICE